MQQSITTKPEKAAENLIDNAGAFSRMSRVRPQTRMIKVAGQQTLFVIVQLFAVLF